MFYFSFNIKDNWYLTAMENIINITKSSAMAVGILKNLVSFEQIDKFNELEVKHNIKLYGKVLVIKFDIKTKN